MRPRSRPRLGARRRPSAPHRAWGLLAAAAVVTAVLAVWLVPRGARACSCAMPPPPLAAFEDSDAVFEARPFGMNPGNHRAVYRFEVDRVWKGDIGDRVEISTAMSGAACGRTYQIGTRYLVYARRSDDGRWTDGLCSRTRTSDAAAEDFAVLGAGRRPDGPPKVPSEGDPQLTEPPRIEPTPEPPPMARKRGGCTLGEKPHGDLGAAWLLLLPLAVAIGRRRTVRSARGRGRP